MNKQVIITKKAGQDIPRGYLQTALKSCPTYLGLATQDKVGDTALLEHTAEKKTYDLDELCKLMATMKDIPCVLSLGHMTQDFDPETDMQPYVFQTVGESKDDEAVDVLGVFLEGDFPNYAKPGKGHTEEYNFWEDYLFPTMLEKLEASQDIEDFYRRLRSSQFEQAVMHVVGHRGVAVFVPIEGELIAFGKNELGGEYDWGTTSNTFGWGSSGKLVEAATRAIEAVKKPAGRLARAMGSTAVTPPTPAPDEVKNPPGVHSTPAGSPSPKKLNEAAPVTGGIWDAFPGTNATTHKMVEVPKGLQGNARNRWIRTFLNLSSTAEMPKGYDRGGFKMPVSLDLIGFSQEDVSTNEDVKRLQSRIIKFRSPNAQSVGSGAAIGDQMQEAVTEPIVAPDPGRTIKPEDDKRPTSDFLPECPADEAKVSVDLVTEWATNPKAPTALEVQRIESKWPLFTITRGIKLGDVARWSMADKKAFTKKCPNDAARLISELMLKLHELGEIKEEPKPVEKQVEVPPTKHVTTPPKTGGRLARAKGQAA